MKHLVFFICVFFIWITNIQGQDLSYEPGVISTILNFNITLQDTSNRQLFNKHPEVKKIIIWYVDGQPAFVRIREVRPSPSLYDLSFKGDILTLQNTYGNIDFKAPSISLNSMISRKKLEFPTHWEITANISPDSVFYTFRYNSGEEPTQPLAAIGFAPRFRGKYEDLAQQIADGLQEPKEAVLIDSVVVIQALVERKSLGKQKSLGERKNVLENTPAVPLKGLKLVAGSSSVFSDIALQILGSKKNFWMPAIYQSGVQGNSAIRFYIQLHPDRSVSMEVPEYGNFIMDRGD